MVYLQINSSSHQHQSVTEFAKPTQGISYTEITTTTERINQRDQLDSMLGVHRSVYLINIDIQTQQHVFHLGNLQADMSRQGVTTTQKGCCNACDKPIVGQVITALGKTWHPEHFTCNHCSQELGTRNFFERDGHPYCEPDYHNLFSPRCAYCNGAILDVRPTRMIMARHISWVCDGFLFVCYRNALPPWRKPGTLNTFSVPSAASSSVKTASTNATENLIVVTTILTCLHLSVMGATGPSWRIIFRR